ncbi:sodium:solute symporter family protein [Pseudarthrobacter sp. BRE9]|uniref:sodium:solute symporter family protein n=1 Tax=Pseudarthrobacter sp. BRE9 TaxID=2962582 RepID=UPI002882CB67|nr:sodium:solute symporter family protein [Pseudarthrobacter sp. BRE9]MDT0169238.1 sodium:solute symporter family protein [Pseudarthrobacter sp. BRE9]
MHALDWIVLSGYFLVMVGIGWWSRRRVHNAADFFTAGGKMPWWLAGISHHMSGYSAAVFVGYAALAYTTGFAVYVWWALSITVACVVGSFLFAPRWPRLRQRLGIISPLEYLTTRYNLPAQQVLAWSGTALKVFDVAAKWAASAILLETFAGVPLPVGIVLVGGVTMVYSTIGGLWADALTDFGQFVIQLVAAIALLVATMAKLGGISSIFGMWEQLPPSHSAPFGGTLTMGFFLAYIVISTVSYNGGTWNLAQRFIAAPTGSSARKSILLSGGLYLVWPLVLFFPMWAAPLLVPNLAQPEQSYALVAQMLLPAGLVGLVLAGMFSHTMAMTSSDANAISAVITRDIIPALRRSRQPLASKTELAAGRLSTFLFIGLSMVIALSADSFGGVLGLLILWFGALVGPIAIPMLLGMLPPFKRCGPSAALFSWAAGLVVFAVNKYVLTAQMASLGDLSQAVSVAAPILASILVYCLMGLIRPWRNEESDALVDSLNVDVPEDVDQATITAGVRA